MLDELLDDLVAGATAPLIIEDGRMKGLGLDLHLPTDKARELPFAFTPPIGGVIKSDV